MHQGQPRVITPSSLVCGPLMGSSSSTTLKRYRGRDDGNPQLDLADRYVVPEKVEADRRPRGLARGAGRKSGETHGRHLVELERVGRTRCSGNGDRQPSFVVLEECQAVLVRVPVGDMSLELSVGVRGERCRANDDANVVDLRAEGHGRKIEVEGRTGVEGIVAPVSAGIDVVGRAVAGRFAHRFEAAQSRGLHAPGGIAAGIEGYYRVGDRRRGHGKEPQPRALAFEVRRDEPSTSAPEAGNGQSRQQSDATSGREWDQDAGYAYDARDDDPHWPANVRRASRAASTEAPSKALRASR